MKVRSRKQVAVLIKKEDFLLRSPLSDPLGVRTQDPNIKSVVLYQLS